MRRSELELEAGDSRLRVFGASNRAQHKGKPIMIYVYAADNEAEFELSRGECKDLRDALIAALDSTEVTP